jgi:4-amino-4-deoxy-L-arabinose transferase-like glycosyltransferase
MTWSKIFHAEKTWLFIWFVVFLATGLLTVHEYGMSIDEPNNYRYAADTLAAYPSVFGILYEPKHDSSYEGHGPAFVALTALVIKTVQLVFPDVFAPDLWHFSYYVTFLLSGLCIYWLTRRWFSIWTTWGILLLFSTQPLLLGHAFINPKDIPFMFFFTLSIVLGFRLVDHEEGSEPFSSLEGAVDRLGYKFRQADPRRKRGFLIFLFLALALALALALFSRQINVLVEQTILHFYAAGPDTWAGRIFSALASQASSSSAKDYAAKAMKLLHRLELSLLVAGLLFFLAYFGLLINNNTLPGFLRNTWNQRNKLQESATFLLRSFRSFLTWTSLKAWLHELIRAFRDSRLILAGIVLGIATAIRAIAPLAGVIVFIYLFLKTRSKSWTTGLAYFLVAGVTTYLLWPYLWAAPIQRYLQELTGASNFQNFSGQVLFNGQFYGIRDLPRLYLPILMNVQFTEPLVLGIYVGLGVLGWRLLRDRVRTDLLIYVGMGFAFPLLMLILLNSPLYHNFRQVLFLAPPLFILAAIALELVFKKLTPTWVRLLIIAIIALPGVYAAAKLYPYQYVYYNSLVGGTAGARDRFEMDYWRTSMREAAVKLNEIAPSGAKIVIGGSSSLFRRYARPDLVVDTLTQNTYDLNGGYDYAVQLARWHKWEVYPDAKIEILIERDGAVIATVRAVRNARLRQ